MYNRYGTYIASIIILILLSISCNDKKLDPNTNNLTFSDFPKEFSAPYLGQAPPQFIIRVTNSGDSSLDYSFSNTQSWLKLIHNSGTNFGSTPDSIFGIIQISNPFVVPIGVHYDTITFSSLNAANSLVQIPIVLHIGSEIETNPEKIDIITTLNGQNPETQYLTVSSTTSEEFDVTLSTNSTHISLSTTNVNTADNIQIPVDIDIAGVPLGVTTDTIYLNADSVLNSPLSFLIEMEIVSWIKQTPPQLQNINDIIFKDSLNGWIVGDITDQTTVSGFIIETSDGGMTWEKNRYFLSSNPSKDSLLGAITFVGDEGWVVGSDAIIFYTSNNGASWTPQTAPVDDTIDFSDVFFVDANNGWIVGDGGLILHTSNGGQTWDLQTSNVTQVLNDLFFLNSQVGWVCGNSDVILATTNAGATWTKLTIPLDTGGVNNNYDFRGIVFTNQNNGYAVAKLGIVLSTTDGGVQWNITKLPEQKNLFSIDFVDETHGWICGSVGAMYYTDNGGQSWTNQQVGTFESINTLDFISPTKGWVAGYKGIIYHTTSAGQ